MCDKMFICSFQLKNFETWRRDNEWDLRKGILIWNSLRNKDTLIIVKFILTTSFGNSNRNQDLIDQNSFFKKTWFHTFVTYVIQSSFQQLALKFQKQNQRLEFSSEILQNVWKDNFISLWDMFQEVHLLLLCLSKYFLWKNFAGNGSLWNYFRHKIPFRSCFRYKQPFRSCL